MKAVIGEDYVAKIKTCIIFEQIICAERLFFCYTIFPRHSDYCPNWHNPQRMVLEANSYHSKVFQNLYFIIFVLMTSFAKQFFQNFYVLVALARDDVMNGKDISYKFYKMSDSAYRWLSAQLLYTTVKLF